MELRLANDPSELNRVHAALSELANEHGISNEVKLAADLSLTEHLTNVIVHGCDPAVRHHIVVRLDHKQGALQIEVEDDGKAFNPLEYPEVDITKPLDEKPVGGLGVHMIRHSMDSIAYRRVDGRNVLSMTKRTP